MDAGWAPEAFEVCWVMKDKEAGEKDKEAREIVRED
jgi:hypothetical protein